MPSRTYSTDSSTTSTLAQLFNSHSLSEASLISLNEEQWLFEANPQHLNANVCPSGGDHLAGPAIRTKRG
jgi:hypothetical protein